MEIDKLIKGFVKKKVVVIGDVMVDEYIRGEVKRLSPETSVPLLLRPRIPAIDDKDELIRLGGAGNTARNITSFGAEVELIGVCGHDMPAGTQMMSLASLHDNEGMTHRPVEGLHRLPIKCNIVQQSDLITTHKMRLINDRFVQLFRVDTEKSRMSMQTRPKECWKISRLLVRGRTSWS